MEKLNLDKHIDHITAAVEKHNKQIATITSKDYETTIKLPDTMYWVTNASAPICRNEPIFIHKTNCPNCGGLLDGDEHIPYVRCTCCGAKIWSEREVS